MTFWGWYGAGWGLGGGGGLVVVFVEKTFYSIKNRDYLLAEVRKLGQIYLK